MKSYKFKIFILFILFVSVNQIFAQQETAYEKKVNQIIEKYYSICYNDYYRPLTFNEKAELRMITPTKEARDAVMQISFTYYANYHTEAQTKQLIKKYLNELENAKRLKTSVDFKREKERKELEAQKKYEESDKGLIEKSIKEKFEKWTQKGEFEKQLVYENRIKSKSKDKYDEICKNTTKHFIDYVYFNNKAEKYLTDNSIKNLLYDKEKELKRYLEQYNADHEFFPVKFKLNNIEWYNKIKIPISKAKHFKNIWSDLELKKDLYNWCFINNYLFPTVISLQKFPTIKTIIKDNDVYKFELPLINQKEITFSFNDLNINNIYLKGYVFNYSKAKELEKKHFIQDSIKFSSLIDKYNHLLLNNPYNTNKEKITGVKPLNNEDNLSERIKDLEKAFEYKKEIVRKKFKTDKPKEYCSIYYSNNPDKKIEADKKYIECKCNMSRDKFDLYFVDDILPDRLCNCREQLYDKYNSLFKNRTEFNEYFNKNDSVLFKNEIAKRKYLLYLKNNKKVINKINFKWLIRNSISSFLLESGKRNYSNYEEQYKDKVKKEIANIISNSQDKNYYNEIVDFIIENNNKLKAEWKINGKYFLDKTVFFDAYLSKGYKKKLRKNKKSMSR